MQPKRNVKQTNNNVDLPNTNLSYKPDDVSPLPDELNIQLDTPVLLPQTQNDELDNQSTPEVKQYNANKLVPISLPKSNQVVKFEFPDKLWKTVTILGLAVNRKGKYKNWVNVSDSNDSQFMDWLNVDQVEVINTNTEATEHGSSDELFPKLMLTLNPMM